MVKTKEENNPKNRLFKKKKRDWGLDQIMEEFLRRNRPPIKEQTKCRHTLARAAGAQEALSTSRT